MIRRLVRLCLHYGNRTPTATGHRVGPTFIACSATIANPRAHFAALVPLNVLGGDDCLTVVDKDTSPRGKKVRTHDHTNAFKPPPLLTVQGRIYCTLPRLINPLLAI